MANFKTPLAFLGGLVTGAAATWVVSAKYFNNKIESEIENIKNDFEEARIGFENDIEELNRNLDEAYLKINKAETARYLAEEALKVEVNSKEEPEMVKKLERIAKSKSKSAKQLEEKPEPEDIVAGRVDYTSYSKPETKKKSDPVPSIDELAAAKPKYDQFLITKKEFECADDDFEKMEITYFSNDDVYIDTEGYSSDNLSIQIGKNNINTLVRESDGVIYVRNATIMIDFKVTLNTMSYQDYLMENSDDDYDEYEEE